MKKGLRKLRIPCILPGLIILLAFAANAIRGTLAEPEQSIAAGSISGLIWSDGNGVQNENQQPIAGYTIYLYAADDLSGIISVAQTDARGAYLFRDMEPGSYVLGLIAGTANGSEYRLPTKITEDNKFEADSVDSSVAYTDIIKLDAGQAVKNIDAVMRPANMDIEAPEAPEDTEEPADTEEAAEEPEDTEEAEDAPEILEEFGSISGFIWADGTGRLSTDWDGLYNGSERPLSNYVVYLYAADDLANVIEQTQTGADGTYAFENLDPGRYAVGISSEIVGGQEYLPPVKLTAESVFTIDMDSTGPMAFSEAFEINEGTVVSGINAGLRLLTGIAARAAVTLANLGKANTNDTVTIDGCTWVVVKKQTVGGMNCAYLIMKGFFYDSHEFGQTTNYDTSGLRNRMTDVYVNYLPTIRAIAVKPTLGNHTDDTALTQPRPEMAGNQTQDILFAPSYADMKQWIGGGTAIPSGHPLHSSGGFPRRFYCRTAINSAQVGGVNISANSLDRGIQIAAMYASDVPAVWVNTGAVERSVNVYYVDTDGNPIGVPNSAAYSVTVGNTFTLNPSTDVPTIPGYEYREWKKGIYGTAQSGSFPDPTLSSAEVIAGTDIYLIYERVMVDVKVTKVVTGHFSNKQREFTFTVYFTDSDDNKLNRGVEFIYSGGTVPGMGAVAPADGALTLDEFGKDSFTLKHGQAITILNVPADVKIRLIEAVDNSYSPSFTDSAGAGGANDTDFRVLSAGGATERVFEFFNAQKVDPVPTGIADGLFGTGVLPMLALLLLYPGWLTIWLILRRPAAK